MDARFTVFVIDEDTASLRATARLVRSAGYVCQPYPSPLQFLDRHDVSVSGCVVLDTAMREIDGLRLQGMLHMRGIEHSLIFVSATTDISTSVQAMRAGAIDFLVKPVNAKALLAAIEIARAAQEQRRQLQDARASIENRLANLTRREREVLTHVIAGRLNKQIAGDLGTVEKTIKVHRGRMMNKMGVHSVAELVRVAEQVGIEPHYPTGLVGEPLLWFTLGAHHARMPPG